jgi:para-nitrobenzyl esterase
MICRNIRRNRILTLMAISFVILTLLRVIASAVPVKVEGGLLEGTVEDTLTVYRGIPFAAPPLGDLRWRPPQPASKWQGVRAADKFGAPCIQTNPALANVPYTPSEDCLYLNVWTPAKRAADRLPVLVWIHGGGFTAGATAERLYHGEHLAKKGVVVVTLGYRLGAFGFLAHRGLSAENDKHVSGNYGLMDMIAGLQWVQKNISAFGGNPKRVIIFGESAGGIAVSMLCASPLAKGLFHGAMSQSGGSFGPVRGGSGGPGENMKLLADAEKAGEAWAAAAGASTVADMRRLSADKVQAAAQNQRGMTWPICDGWVIPDDQYKLYQAGRYNDTPILVGYNSDEGATFGVPRTPEAYVESVRQRYGSFAERLLALYPAGDGTVAKTARDLTRDVAFGWPTWAWARLQAKTGKSKVFFYYFDHHPEYPAGSPRAGFGAAHGAEVPYVFQHLDLPRLPPATAEDQDMAEMMATFWTNFAKYGDPNGKGLPSWPAFSGANPQVMHFTNKAQAGPVVSEEGLKGLDAYFEWRRTGATDVK